MLYYVCQFGCGILKMVGPIMQNFCLRINMLKGNCFKTILRWFWIVKKCQNHTFEVNFLCQKLTESFQKNQSKNINFGDYFCKKTFLFNFNFWTPLFSKVMFKFWRTGAPRILKIQWCPLSLLIFGQKKLLFRTHHL